MPQTRIDPIQEQDLPAIGQFLHQNLNKRISADAWMQSLTHPWSEARPNFGVQMRDGEKLVGVFCAIYSDQVIDGKLEKFCNPHSWCVLEEYRNQGINLVLSLVRQRGFHFTMLTPNPKVAEIFRHLKFKDLADTIVVFPNLASPYQPGRANVIEADRARIGAHLAEVPLRDFTLHRDIPWLNFVVFGVPGDTCLIAYKHMTWKKLPGAWINYVSDPSAFERHASLLKQHLLYGKGKLVSKIEGRFLSREPSLCVRFRRTQGKLFLSPTLRDSQIKDFYSELASLDV